MNKTTLTRLASAITCATALSLALLPAQRAAAAPAAAPAAAETVARVVELTNVERQKAGLAPLVPNDSLAKAALDYSTVLASGDCFAHTCGPVPDFAKRLVNAGYTGYNAIAENIAGGQRTPEAVVSAWMNSPGHRANILNPAYTEIGVGAYTGGGYGIYWTQEFGARRGVTPAPAKPAPVAPAPAPAVPAAPAPAVPSADVSAPDAADAAAPAPAPAPVPASAQPAPVDSTQLEQMVLDLVNQARIERGVAPLTLDPLMSDVAREHAADMMANGINHTGSDGSTARERLLRAGVRLVWNGENIWSYWGRRTPANGPQTMHDAMMAEPLEPGNWNHIANILLTTYHRIGIGIVISPEGVQYLSEEFAD